MPANSQKPHALELESRVGAKTAPDPNARVDQERGGLPPPPGARGSGGTADTRDGGARITSCLRQNTSPCLHQRSPTHPALGSLWSLGNTAASTVPSPARLVAVHRTALVSPTAQQGGCSPRPCLPRSPPRSGSPPWRLRKELISGLCHPGGCGDLNQQVNVCSLLSWKKSLSLPP